MGVRVDFFCQSEISQTLSLSPLVVIAINSKIEADPVYPFKRLVYTAETKSESSLSEIKIRVN